MQSTNIEEKLATFSERWQPRKVAEFAATAMADRLRATGRPVDFLYFHSFARHQATPTPVAVANDPVDWRRTRQ